MEDTARTQRWSRGIVLLVDDDDECRHATGTLLKAAGFEALEAASANTALDQGNSLQSRLDVLIVDYGLGGERTGTQVAEALVHLMGHALVAFRRAMKRITKP